MQIRPLRPADLTLLDIDGTIESTQYLHVQANGEGLARAWSLDPRPLREKRIDANRVGDDLAFTLKQTVTGIEDGVALAAEHRDQVVATLLAQPNDRGDLLRLLDVRVDYDSRREGLATALIFQAIAHAREKELRALHAECQTNNHPAAGLLAKCGFELCGLDTLRHSNHDLVKEAVTLLWYLPLT